MAETLVEVPVQDISSQLDPLGKRDVRGMLHEVE